MIQQEQFARTSGPQPQDIIQGAFLGVDYVTELSKLPQRGRLADSENMLFDGGRADRIDGCTQVGSTITGSSAADLTIKGLFEYSKVTNNTNELLAYVEGAFYKESGGSFVDAGKSDVVSTNGYDMEMINANDYLYGVNGDEYHLRYDGSSWTEQTSKPLGRYIVEWHDRLWWAGNETYPSRLYFTDLGNYDAFTATNYIDFRPNDGERIMGLGIAYDQLVIFKKSHKGFYDGNAIAVYPVEGTVSHKAIGKYNRTLLYPGESNIYLLNGMEASPVGEPMRPLWEGTTTRGRTGANTAQRSKTAGIVFEEKYWMALTRSGSSGNDEIWVYDISEGWWAPLRDPDDTYLKAHRLATYTKSDGSIGLICGDYDGKVWELNAGENFDDGSSDAAVKAYITTGKFVGQSPHKQKRCLRAMAKGKANGSTRSVAFSYQREQDQDMTSNYRALGSGVISYDEGYQYDDGNEYATSQEDMIQMTVPGKWRGVQMKLYYDEANATFYINNLTLHRVREDRFALA